MKTGPAMRPVFYLMEYLVYPIRIDAMATKTILKVYSDLSGEEIKDAETTTFSLDGETYVIDLTGKERAELEKALAKFIKAARPAKRDGRKGSSTPGLDPAAVRSWAREQKLDIPSRGRIPAAVLEAYKAAH